MMRIVAKYLRKSPHVPNGQSCFTLLICFLPFFSIAQNAISTNQFLATALNDQSILLHERQLDFLKNTDHELPWAKGLEFRTETDEMNLNRQEYLMRFRYHTKAEIKVQRNLHRSNIEIEELEKRALLEEALMEHYFLLVKYFMLDREINLVKQQELVLADQLKVFRRKSTALADVDLSDLLNIEEKHHEKELALLELQGEIGQLKRIFNTALNSTEDIQFDTANFLNVFDIKEKIRLLSQESTSSLSLSEYQLDLDKVGLELEKEKAENNWQLDYVQFKHAGRNNLNYAQEWSFGLGMEIPLRGADKLKKNEIMLERIEIENKQALQEISLVERMNEIYEELDVKIKMHELASRQLAESQLQFSFDTYPQLRDPDPLILLNIKSNILRRQADQLKIENDIYLLYLDIVELSGKAVELPLRNYLTKDWEIVLR